ILGGQLSLIMSWRGIFGVLAGFGAVLLLAGWFGLKETLPPERRIVGGLRRTLQSYNTLLHDRFFVGCALSSGLAGATMFAYIAGSSSCSNGSTGCLRRASRWCSDVSPSARLPRPKVAPGSPSSGHCRGYLASV